MHIAISPAIGMDAHVNPDTVTTPRYGVHDLVDKDGSYGGMEVVARCDTRVSIVRAPGLLDATSANQDKWMPELGRYFRSPPGAHAFRRRILVVVRTGDGSDNPPIQDCLAACKAQGLLQDYTIFPLAIADEDSEKTVQAAQAVIAAAERSDLGRRDLFVAVGGGAVADVVGFAAATYRRSTGWISIATDHLGAVLGCAAACHGTNELRLHHTTSRDGAAEVHRDLLGFSHPPIATFYDPASLLTGPPPQGHRARSFWAEMLRIAVVLGQDSDLFLHVEAHMESMLLGVAPGPTHLATAVDLAAAGSATLPPSPVGGLGAEAVRAIRLIKSDSTSASSRGADDADDADCLATAVGLMAALSARKGNLRSADLVRILNLFRRAGLRTYDGELEPLVLWENMVLAASVAKGGRESALEFLVPGGSGQGSAVEISRADVDAALSVLCDHDGAEKPAAGQDPRGGRVAAVHTVKAAAESASAVGPGDWAVHERTVWEHVRYRVVSVPQLFDKSNPTLIRDHCTAQETTVYKKKILVVVDTFADSVVPLVSGYFESHGSAIDGFRVLPVHIPSTRKDTDAALAVVDAAVGMGLSWRDLVVVVGGGTLMDVVGFASSMLQGGIPYVRIPTTLLGMIDAGVGVKVGVDFGGHKSTIGRYCAPVACLNDPERFLSTLPARELACGLAEAIKMAVVKSPRILEIIETHYRLDGIEHLLDTDATRELIHLSIRSMLEELQPNLYEKDLRRLVDFGHEFGHIIETQARFQLPHGECVSIGIAISSALAHRKGILARPDLERILNCLLDVRLPIFATCHGCCDPDLLSAKISTDVPKHKDSMLYLVVPETVGKGTFLDRVTDIDAEMLREAMLGLRRHAESHRAALARNPRRGSPLPDACANEPAPSTTMTAAVIGASGNIGSQLVRYLAQTSNARLVCSVRHSALRRFKRRAGLEDADPAAQVRVLVGDVLDVANLQTMIREAHVIYSMAGAVTLGAHPEEFAAVLALNGFAQAVIAHFVRVSGRSQCVRMVYPSSRRVHLVTSDERAHIWVRKAAAAYVVQREMVLASQDIFAALEAVAARFLSSHPPPDGVNIYELSKLLGEYFVSQLPRYSLVRISSVYGPGFTRGFISRAIGFRKANGKNVETAGKRYFIYNGDLNELLWKAGAQHGETNTVFDAASGESMDLQEVWATVRAMTGSDAAVTFLAGTAGVQAKVELRPDPTFARQLLGKGFTPIHVGLGRTIDYQDANPAMQEGGEDDRNGIQNGIQKGTQSFTQPKQPHVIVVDVGATNLRVGIMGPQGLLPHETTQHASPSKQRYPCDSLSALQQKLLETLADRIGAVTARHPDLLLEEVGIALGAVVTHKGIVQDASILWGEPASGYDLASALQERLPGARFTILNDVSAAAWRYKDEGRFCLITVSSGLGNKVFNANLDTLDRLDLDAAGVGGEMGHVVVEPRAVDVLVQHAISRATSHPDEFQASKVAAYANGEARRIDARHLGMAANEGDDWALRLLRDADVPYCPCGNIADLCAYSSGRAALRRARSLAARQEHYGVPTDDITDSWLQQAVAAGHPLALQVLRDVTYYVALRILQLAADIGLDKFIIVGGFASRTAGNGAYLEALRQRLVHLCHTSGFFRGWEEDRIRGLVKAGIDDDNAGLVGMGYFVQHLRSHYAAVEKPVREQALVVKTKRIPDCGAREILVKVVYGGICTTDLQILRHERGLEPVILGHEGVCRVVEVGENVRGLEVGEMVVLNPNNPLDDHDKLGHTREGLFQEYIKVGQEFLDRSQVLRLGRSTPSPMDTLIEPLSCVVAAQGRIRDRIPGRNVLVVGAGFMGLLFVMINGKMGARNVFLTNRSKQRLDMAESSGIVEPGKAFVADGSASASPLVDKVTAGEGVDIVIICVSLGQGVRAAQDAIAYVNPGGCVYLFAGFRPGDMLALEDGGGGAGAKLDAWSVRTGWRTERIQTFSGKCVDVSGHRGSRQEDLATAAEFVRQESLLFSKVVSHVISLDAMPESMLTLARDHTIRGVPARRVIVDMEAPHGVVEPAEKLPLRHLREAAGRSKKAIGSGNLFREIGFEGDTSHLGWVHPPTWPEIEASLESALGVSGLGSKRHVIWVGTGGWIFSVAALRSMMPTSGGGPIFHTCDSLDPQVLQDVLLSIDDLSTAVCLGISQSGKTLETVALMNALREFFDNAGLD
ncbi:hypothetical protein QBC44DRAFT_294886 [Cladorrhinum sp. PSN332]|nr:hypothetical protein QBC44DRAFT_294886 [Cladorrhinum sp. PSN332]